MPQLDDRYQLINSRYIQPGVAIVTMNATAGANGVLLVNATAGPITITLPPAENPGRTYYIQKIDDSTNPVIVVPNGDDTIDGLPLSPGAQALALGGQFDAVELTADGNAIPPTTAGAWFNLNSPRRVNYATRTITADIAADDVDGLAVILADAAAGPITVDLPSAVGRRGRAFFVKKLDASANAVTVDPSGTQTIDGAATFVFAAGDTNDAIEFVSDGDNWFILAHNP